ncbi:MAG: spermidine synthase [Bacteroidales bacterium]
MSWSNWIVDAFKERVISRTGSQYNPTLEVIRSGNHLVLDAKSVNYSYGGLHRAFRQLFRKIRISKWNIGNVLILGFGAGSIASILQHEYQIDCKITGVEIDPEVIRIGKEYFRFNSFSNLNLIEQDAILFIEENSEFFDIVVVDLYLDKEVPPKAETSEFADFIKKALKTEGHLIFNKWIHDTVSMESAARLEKVLTNTFDNLIIYRTGHNRTNRMMVCRRTD